jgi:hypothetical protein
MLGQCAKWHAGSVYREADSVVQIVRGLLAAMYVSVIMIPSARSPIPAATIFSAVQYYRAGR